MQKRFADLVDIQALQQLMDSLHAAIGITSALVDKDLTVLTATGWQDICTKFHRVNPETLQKCKQSDSYIAENIYRGSYVGYRCQNGMLDYACPIIIEGEHLATLFIGQFFSEAPQEEFFRQQAKKYGFDEEAYIAALRKVPILKETQVELCLKFFAQLAKLMADMGLRGVKQLEINNFLQSLIDAIPIPVFYKDINGVYQGCNRAFEEFQGKPKKEVIGRTVYDLAPPELAKKYEAMDAELFRNPIVQIYEYQACNNRGEKREVLFNKAPFMDLKGEVAGIVGVFFDITEQKQLNLALKSSEAKYRALFNNLINGFIYFEGIMDEHSNIVDYQVIEVNNALEKLTGLNKHELIGRRISESAFSTDDTLDWIKIFNDTAVSGETCTMEYFSTLLERWFLVSSYSPQTGYCAIILSDITEQKRNIEMAQHYAYHDSLTGLPNRRMFEDRLALAIAQGKRNGEIIAVVFLDLDNFKYVNDTLGHQGGDILLIEVAQRLIVCSREGDTVSRLGGDEFVLILPQLKDINEASPIAMRILEKCSQPFHIKEKEIQVSASIGISFFPQDGEDITSLVRNADIAMYSSKEQGRNRISYSDRCIVTVSEQM